MRVNMLQITQGTKPNMGFAAVASPSGQGIYTKGFCYLAVAYRRKVKARYKAWLGPRGSLGIVWQQPVFVMPAGTPTLTVTSCQGPGVTAVALRPPVLGRYLRGKYVRLRAVHTYNRKHGPVPFWWLYYGPLVRRLATGG